MALYPLRPCSFWTFKGCKFGYHSCVCNESFFSEAPNLFSLLCLRRAYTVVGENVECRLESLTRLKREDKMGLLWSCKHLIKILVPKIFLETVPNYFIPIGRRLHS
ncbi:unnamed protein product [Urochloa humidicola]